MSTLAACKECPGDWNAAPSQRQKLRLGGNGVARCSAWVRWWHVLRTTIPTYTADFCVGTEAVYKPLCRYVLRHPIIIQINVPVPVWSMHPNFFSVGITVKGIWRGVVLPWDSSRMRLGRTAGQGTWRLRYNIQYFLWHAGLHVFMLPWELSSRGDSSQAKCSTSCTLSIHP